jgi:hypothetical protein
MRIPVNPEDREFFYLRYFKQVSWLLEKNEKGITQQIGHTFCLGLRQSSLQRISIRSIRI